MESLRRSEFVGNCDLKDLKDNQHQFRARSYQRKQELPRFRSGICKQGSFHLIAERQTHIQIESEPWIRIIRIERSIFVSVGHLHWWVPPNQILKGGSVSIG